MNVLETAALGFGLIGCVVLGNKAAKHIALNGGNTIDQMAGAALVGGVGAVLYPITVVAGVAYTGQAGYRFYKEGKHKTIVQDTKAKFQEAKELASEKIVEAKAQSAAKRSTKVQSAA